MSSVNRVLWELRRGTGEDREKRAGFRLGLSLAPGWRTVQQSLAAVDFNELTWTVALPWKSKLSICSEDFRLDLHNYVSGQFLKINL